MIRTRALILLSISLGIALSAPTPAHAHRCMDLFAQQRAKRTPIQQIAQPIGRKHKVSLLATSFRRVYGEDHVNGAYIMEDLIAVSKVEQRTKRTLHHTTYEHDNIFVEILRPMTETDTNYRKYNFPTSEGNHEHQINRMRARFGKDGATSKVNDGSWDLMLGKTLESLDFVMKQYRDRKQWPPQFLKDLVARAFQFASHSTYITVREKLPDGQPGAILGTVRLIQTPYFNIMKARELFKEYHTTDQQFLEHNLRNELGAIMEKLDVDLSQFPGLDRALWSEIYGGQARLKIENRELATPEAKMDGDLAYVPTPMELVLRKDFPQHREDPGYGIQYYVEPGNFAVTPDRELPDHLRKVAPAALYFHAARLLREQSGALGPTKKIGTYASEGGASDRYYQYLGFKLEESLAPDRADGHANPTPEVWNVLGGDGSALNEALRKRILSVPVEQTKNIENLFEPFDRYETGRN